MTNHATQERCQRPYLHANYNISAYYAPKQGLIRSFLARIINALITGINDAVPQHLPRYILIMLDADLIREAKVFDFGVSRMIEDCIKWLLINVNMAIETRKADLMEKRPGAVSSTSEPRIISISMIKRPEDRAAHKQIYVLTRKFNNILEDVIAGDKRLHLMKPHVEQNQQNFDIWGNLTTNGKTEFWKQVNQEMKRFDRGKTDLRPFPQVNAINKHKWINPKFGGK